MKHVVALTLILSCCGIAGGKVLAKEQDKQQKLYVIDLPRLVGESQEGKSLAENLSAAYQSVMEKIRSIKQSFESKQETFEKQKMLMSQEKRAEKQQELAQEGVEAERSIKASQEDFERQARMQQEGLARKLLQQAIEIGQKEDAAGLLNKQALFWVNEKTTCEITQRSIQLADAVYTKERMAAAEEKEAHGLPA